MPKAQPFRGPVVVSGVTFRTKKSLGKYVEGMRDADQINQRFMLDLFKFHARYAEKLNGRTVHKFKVNARGDGFEIVFKDGSLECASFRKMIKNAWQTYGRSKPEKQAVVAKNKAQSLAQSFKRAARYEVYGQTRRFRLHKASANAKFLDGRAWHVGHDYDAAKRFEELLEDFFREQPEGTTVHVKSVVDGGYQTMWVERDLAVAWKAYHQKHAVLRMETWQSNLGGNKGFAAKEKWALKYVRE